MLSWLHYHDHDAFPETPAAMRAFDLLINTVQHMCFFIQPLSSSVILLQGDTMMVHAIIPSTVVTVLFAIIVNTYNYQ